MQVVPWMKRHSCLQGAQGIRHTCKCRERAVGIQKSGGELTSWCLFSLSRWRQTTLLPFLKQGFPCSGPTCFFLFPSAALELFFILPSEKYTGVGKVTQTLVQSPALFPAGIFPGSFSFLLGSIQLLCCYSLYWQAFI